MNTGEYIIFELENTVFGIPSELVKEVRDLTSVTLSSSPKGSVIGTIAYGSQRVNVIDARHALGLSRTTSATVLVVVGHGQAIGLAVNTVTGRITVSSRELNTAINSGFFTAELDGKQVEVYMPNLIIPESIALEGLAEST